MIESAISRWNESFDWHFTFKWKVIWVLNSMSYKVMKQQEIIFTLQGWICFYFLQESIEVAKELIFSLPCLHPFF
jgi:hypothetical protein